MLKPVISLWLVCLSGGMFLCARTDAKAQDVSAAIAQQDARLGARAGAIVITTPGVLQRDVAVGAGHNLILKAPLRFGHAGIHLGGHNQVTCSAPLEASEANELFVAQSVTDLGISHCSVTQLGAAGGYLLAATASARITMTDNHLQQLAIFTTHNLGGAASQTTDVTLTGNSTAFPQHNGPIGIYLLQVIRATVTGNFLEGTTQGIEWWGGDANGGWRGPASVKNAGEMSIRGNRCKAVGGACVWGAMGYSVTVDGNKDEGCGDVCFDDEGGVNTTFTNNEASGCGFGCYAAEFESQGATFRNNKGTTGPGQAIVLIKHAPGNPYSHKDLVIEGNTFSCPQLCKALYSEGDDGLTFAHNMVTNGVIEAVNYHGDFTVRANMFTYTVDPGSKAAIAGPALFHHHASQIVGNVLTNRATTDAATVCIAQSWSDFNDADSMTIAGNTCSGFQTGIVTATGGANPGAPRAEWVVRGNRVVGAAPGRAYLHSRMAGNESYTFAPDNTADGVPPAMHR